MTTFWWKHKAECENYQGISFNNGQWEAYPTYCYHCLSTSSMNVSLPPIQRQGKHDIHINPTPRKMLSTEGLLYMAFTRVYKAFDMVDHQLLWSTLLRHFHHKKKYIRMSRLLHNITSVTVLSNRDRHWSFHYEVSQRYVIVPSMFAIFIVLHLVNGDLMAWSKAKSKIRHGHKCHHSTLCRISPRHSECHCQGYRASDIKKPLKSDYPFTHPANHIRGEQYSWKCSSLFLA